MNHEPNDIIIALLDSTQPPRHGPGTSISIVGLRKGKLLREDVCEVGLVVLVC